MTKAVCHAHAECIKGNLHDYVGYTEIIRGVYRNYIVNARFLYLTLIRGHGKGDDGGVSGTCGVYKRETT